MKMRRVLCERWLCLLVWICAALPGCGESGGPAGPAGSDERQGEPWFQLATGSGIDFQHQSGASGELLYPEIICGGGALLDADGDGDLDAYLVQSGSLEAGAVKSTNRLYENLGEARFRDVSDGSGADDGGYGAGAAVGDVDDDGRPDLYVTNVARDALLRNLGGMRFEEITERAGLTESGWSTSAAFLDLDRDGDLDLYVARYLGWSAAREISCFNSFGVRDYCLPTNYNAPLADRLFRNDGTAVFEDISESAGITIARGTGLGVGCADFDQDGLIDIFVANDAMANFLWHNNGDGTFAEVAMEQGCAVDVNGMPKAGMGVVVEDVDSDLDMDIVVCNLYQETDSYFRNDGSFFSDRTANVGLAVTSRSYTRFGMAMFDFDQDGHLDLFQANGRVNQQESNWSDDIYAEPNALFRGTGAGRLEEVLPRGGTAEPLFATSRGAAFGDVDGDGSIDVLVINKDDPAHLLLNRAPARGNWILLQVLEASGRDALGAELRIRVGERTLRRDVRSAFSYMAGNDPRIHLGLGSVAEVNDIEVRWADGSKERFGPRPAGAAHTLRRGEGEAVSGG